MVQSKLSQLQRQMLCKILSEVELWSRASEGIRRETELYGVRYEPRSWFPPYFTSPSLSRALSRLEQRGLVMRVNIYDPTDVPDLRPARTTHIRLTPEGFALATELQPKKKKRLT